MPPIFDVDVLLLLATALAAKRRPAEPAAVMAAIDLIQGNIPSEEKLSEGFARLGQRGLLVDIEGCLGLTAAGEKMIEALPRKGDLAERLADLRSQMAAHAAPPEADAIHLAPEALRAAILAHRAAAKDAPKNLLVPKPKPAESGQSRPGQRRRKPAPTRQRQR